MLNRRKLIHTTAVLGVASAMPAIKTSAQTPEGDFVSRIGGTRGEFDSEYGVGREQDGWVVYGEDDPATAYYNVLFNADGIAETIEIDFRHFEGGGLPTENELGQSRFIPDDGEMQMRGTAGAYRANDPYYQVAQWHSPSLAEAIGRSGNVIVLDALIYTGAMGGTVITHTMVSMETFEVNALVPTDEFLGPHSGIEAWEEYTGQENGMFGLGFTNGPVPGEWMATEISVSVVPDPPLPVAEANDLVGSMMPMHEIIFTTYIPPSPLGAEGIRVHGLNSNDADWRTTIAAQWVDGGEESGTVTQILTGSTIVSASEPSAG